MVKRKVIVNAKDFEEYVQSGEFTNPTEKVSMNFLTLDLDKVDTSDFNPLEKQCFEMFKKCKKASDKALIKYLDSR